jgi:3'-5' exoribonuclease
MTATTELAPRPPSLSDWHDGSRIDAVVLVRNVEQRTKRDGAPFLKLVLGDRSGTVPAVMWSPDTAVGSATIGTPVRVAGRYGEDPRYGRQLTVSSLRAASDDEIDWHALLEGPTQPAADLERALDELLASIHDPHLATLITALLGADTMTGRAFRCAPAAKFNHHAYRHGLLEHSVDVAHGVSALCSVFGADRDIAVCGALLHDIGKLDAYDPTPAAIDLTDPGKLLGEIPLGYYRVRRELERHPGFPPDSAQQLLHIVLSHHGRLEHGSPVLPSTREAVLVHTIDNLSGQMGAFDRLQKDTPTTSAWSRFDRVLETAAYFPVINHTPTAS